MGDQQVADQGPSATSGIALERLTHGVRPQDDLYRHVNGSWLDTTEIPADKPVYGAFHELHDEAELRVREIVEDAAASDAPADSDQRKIGDLYADFLDEDAVERLGASPIAGGLAL